MPAWWGKKSSSSRKKEETKKGKEKTKSFDEILARKSAKNSGVFSSASGFDSDGALEKRGHPLPSPSTLAALGQDQGTGSGSASSVSSSGSSDEPPDLGFMGLYRYSDPANSPRGRSIECNSRKQIAESGQQISLSPFSDSSKHPDLSTSPGGEFPIVSTAMKFNPRSRSPGPTSRPHSLLSSPLHPRASGFNPDSPTERQEDGKNLGHPLPLPPGSPNSSFSSHTLRSNGVHDNGQSLRSKWKKGKLLGRGTFGHVYVGFNSESGQMCAIKEVRVISDDQNSKECLRQLNQEITLLSQLSHPNIVQYYGSELAEETLSVYLEYVSGGSIHKLLQEYGYFKEPVIQSYARQILSGLAYLHGRKTVHRDIKGANILVDPSGVIKLADFGMAKHITTCTNVLSFKGSPYWMAPEVIMNSNGYNLAVDIWSLGCTILEMATSKPPWSQYEGVAAIFKIGNSKDIPEIPDHISEEGKKFLKLCLQREPSARPTAAQLLEHPFVRDHTAPKIVRVNLSRELQPSTPDGRHSPNSTEFQTNRSDNRSCDEDYGMRQRAGFPTAFNDLSEGIHTRMNMSLPVSPCSSPLRRSGPAHRSCFLSPPHLTYTMGISDYGYNTHPILPPTRTGNQVRRLSENFLDLRADIIQLKSQTPDASPRSQHKRSVCL